MSNFIVTAAEDAEAWVLKEAKAAAGACEGVFVNDIEPAIELFLKQFATDFGKACLSLGGAFIVNLLNKTSTIATSAPHLVQSVVNAGIQIGEQDALDVAGNALRVLVTNASAPVVAPATVEPVANDTAVADEKTS